MTFRDRLYSDEDPVRTTEGGQNLGCGDVPELSLST